MGESRYYFANQEGVSRFVNRWDVFLLILLFSGLFFLAWAGSQMASPYQLGEPLPISLDPSILPFYAMRTVLRMGIAMAISLAFTFCIGVLAARNRRAGMIIIPAIDVLQSVPVLSFLSITVAGFIRLFPGSMLGPECACIFAIFTSQVWNMTFGFYQSLITVPHDLREAADMFQLSSWQRFWKIEVPFSMPGLIWNMMVSMSASWFFVVLSEAISVAHQDIRLPGVGSWIAVAIEQRDLRAVGWAIVTMVIVIFLFDQLVFRPLLAWSEKFRMEQTPDEDAYQSWLVDWFRRSHLHKQAGRLTGLLKTRLINLTWLRKRTRTRVREPHPVRTRLLDILWGMLLLLSLAIGLWWLSTFILDYLRVGEVLHVILLGSATALRVVILIVVSSLVWIPVGVWIGLRPSLSGKIQPVIQFAAAFPANLFYPIFVIAIVRFGLNVEIWVTPLMILGTQWYILFNVIAGASAIPRDLYLAADNLGLRGWQWWKRLALPGIFPFYITGAISAAGGAWNASIVAEWVSWGSVTLKATGLGEYIQASTINGDFPKIALGTAVMCLYVLTFNHLIWRPLYRLAQERFHCH